MNMNEIVRLLRAACFSLESVETKGYDNMQNMVGSIQMINRAAAMLEKGMKELDMQKPEVHIEPVPEEEIPKEE